MSESKHTIGDLRQMQSLPLEAKIRMTEYRQIGTLEEVRGVKGKLYKSREEL